MGRRVEPPPIVSSPEAKENPVIPRLLSRLAGAELVAGRNGEYRGFLTNMS